MSQPEISSPEEIQDITRTVHSPSTQLSVLLGPGKGTKRTAHLGLCPCRAPKNPRGLVRPGKCTKHRDHSGQCSCRAPWSLSSVDPGSTCHLGLWQTKCDPSAVSTLHICQQHLFPMSFPPHNTTEQVSLNKWPPLSPCVRVETRH